MPFFPREETRKKGSFSAHRPPRNILSDYFRNEQSFAHVVIDDFFNIHFWFAKRYLYSAHAK